MDILGIVVLIAAVVAASFVGHVRWLRSLREHERECSLYSKLAFIPGWEDHQRIVDQIDEEDPCGTLYPAWTHRLQRRYDMGVLNGTPAERRTAVKEVLGG